MPDDAQNKPNSKQQLAEKRTETAWERTLLAEERTFSAWVRTGLAAVAAGFALVRLMGESGPLWMIRSLGVLFISAGGVMFFLGFWTYRSALKHTPQTPIRGIPTWVLGVITLGLVLGAAAALFLVFQSGNEQPTRRANESASAGKSSPLPGHRSSGLIHLPRGGSLLSCRNSSAQ